MSEDRDYVVGRLPGRKSPALYRITTEAHGGAWIQPLAYFRDEEDMARFVRDLLNGQRVLVSDDVAQEVEDAAL